MEFINESRNEFLTSHIRDLELLILQFGIRVGDAEKVIEEILSALNDASTLDRFTFYQSALFTLQTYKESVVNTEHEIDGKKFFLYKEDEQFHRSLTSLSNDFKLPFILHNFHGFNPEDLSELLNQSEDDINHRVDLAKKHMMEELNLQPDQFGKSLEFMKKTYHRLPKWIDQKILFLKDNEGSGQGKSSDAKQKDQSIFLKQMIFVSLIIVFFSSLFVISVTGAGQVDEQYIAQLEQEFDDTLEERREQLGLRKEVYNQLGYISNAKSLFISYKNELNRKLASGKEMKRKKVKKEFKKVLDSFELPSEMAADLFRKPLRNNKEESEIFLESYSKRLHEINRAFTIESNSKVGESLKEKLQKGMESQNVSLSNRKFYNTAEFKESDFTKQLRSSLYPSLEPYITMLLMEGQIYYEDPQQPDELVDAALILENILLNDTRRTYLYGHARNLYSQTFVALTNGPSIYRKDMTIKDEYRLAWIEFSEKKETSPMGKVLSDIVTEMKESNWRSSKTLRYIDTSRDLDRALTLAQEGNLQQYQPTERIFQSYEYSSIQLPDESFQQTVVDIYKLFEEQAELQSRTNFVVNPLLVVGAYDIAQREGNGKVLWQLTWNFYQYEKFLEHFEVGSPILVGVDRISFDPEWIHYNRGVVYPILFERNGVTEIGLWLSQIGPDWTIEKIVSEEDDEISGGK